MATDSQNNMQDKTNSIRYNPPKDYASPVVSRFINWIESMNFKYSVFEDQPVYS